METRSWGAVTSRYFVTSYALLWVAVYGYLVEFVESANSTDTGTTSAQRSTSDQIEDANVPLAMITIVVLALLIILGLVIAKGVDHCHTRRALRDDASDISDFTKDLLKAQFMYAFNKKLISKIKSKETVRQRARRMGRIWASRARRNMAKRMAEEQEAELAARGGEKGDTGPGPDSVRLTSVEIESPRKEAAGPNDTRKSEDNPKESNDNDGSKISSKDNNDNNNSAQNEQPGGKDNKAFDNKSEDTDQKPSPSKTQKSKAASINRPVTATGSRPASSHGKPSSARGRPTSKGSSSGVKSRSSSRPGTATSAKVTPAKSKEDTKKNNANTNNKPGSSRPNTASSGNKSKPNTPQSKATNSKAASKPVDSKPQNLKADDPKKTGDPEKGDRSEARSPLQDQFVQYRGESDDLMIPVKVSTKETPKPPAASFKVEKESGSDCSSRDDYDFLADLQKKNGTRKTPDRDSAKGSSVGSKSLSMSPT